MATATVRIVIAHANSRGINRVENAAENYLDKEGFENELKQVLVYLLHMILGTRRACLYG